MGGKGGGGGKNKEQKRLTQLQLDEYKKLEETQKRQKAVMMRRRTNAGMLFSSNYGGIPGATKQSLTSL
jgi:hypothetical protein